MHTPPFWSYLLLSAPIVACVSGAGYVDLAGADAESVGGRGASGAGGAGMTVGPPAGSGEALPCEVRTILEARCWTCHGPTVLPGVPASLVTYGQLTAPSRADAGKTNAQRAAARARDDLRPMPPAPAMRLAAADVAVLDAWIAAGYPGGTACDAPGGGGGAGGGGGPTYPPAPDPFSVPPTCTSGTTWTGGDHGSPDMDPGMACIDCHTRSAGGGEDEVPRLALGGTLFPTAHEPDLCNGTSGGASGASVVIVGADGRSITLTPNGVGNFYYEGALALPYQAKVVYMGRERVMFDKQTSGDCNACHTQAGAGVAPNLAPGRIILP